MKKTIVIIGLLTVSLWAEKCEYFPYNENYTRETVYDHIVTVITDDEFGCELDTRNIEAYEKCNIPRLAYMLATVRIESYAWRTGVFFGIISEQISYAKAEVDYGCGATARRKRYARSCGCRNDGDGYKYRGRGFVQITWKINYQRFNGVKGINFSDNPEKMLDFDILIGVMVEGMEQGLFSHGNTLSKYFNETTKDYLGARHIINGTDKNTIIAGYAEEIEKCLTKSLQ